MGPVYLARVAASLTKTQQSVVSPEVSLQHVSDALQVQTQVCQAAARSLLEQDDRGNKKQIEATLDPTTSSNTMIDISQPSSNSNSNDFDDMEAAFFSIMEPKTDLRALLSNLRCVLDSFPHQGPVVLELDEACPTAIVAEDLLLFRSALNLVSNSMQRTNNNTSQPDGTIHVRIRRSISQEDDGYLVVETQDCGPVVNQRTVKKAFRDPESLLGPVGTMVQSMGGSCGMRLGRLDDKCEEKGSEIHADDQCIFWFRIPLELPEMSSSIYDDANHSSAAAPAKGLKLTLAPKTDSVEPVKSTTTHKNIDDPFQAALIQSGCLSY